METGDTRQNSFNPTTFRNAIEFAMSMGLPTDAAERVTFVWKDVNTYAQEDSRNAPYDFSVAPDTTVGAADIPASLSVPCAVEFRGSKTTSGSTNIGEFNAATIELTLLDTSYDQIIDATLGLPDIVMVDGSTYDIDYWSPPVALFVVDVYQVTATARDEK
jgi:hypothetical protein